MPLDASGYLQNQGATAILLDAMRNGSALVQFRDRHRANPAVLVVPNAADFASGASYTATSITPAGFALVVSASVLAGSVVRVRWTAREMS